MKIVPYKLAPLEDESPTSWILRLARKYHCDVVTFLEYNDCSDLLKIPLDIDGDLSQLQKFVPIGYDLPITLSQKIIHFDWIKGRSNWLIGDNRKGSTTLNSFSQFCPSCIKRQRYYQLKWKISLFTHCVECNSTLICKCPKCKSYISLHRHFKLWKPNLSSIHYLNCSRCEYELKKTRVIQSTIEEIELQLKIRKAYMERPPNLEYLGFIHSKNLVRVI